MISARRGFGAGRYLRKRSKLMLYSSDKTIAMKLPTAMSTPTPTGFKKSRVG